MLLEARGGKADLFLLAGKIDVSEINKLEVGNGL